MSTTQKPIEITRYSGGEAMSVPKDVRSHLGVDGLDSKVYWYEDDDGSVRLEAVPNGD